MRGTSEGTAIGNWRTGTIGFAYDDWAGVFYPAGLQVKDRLAYYATQFDAIELDTTFYGLPTTSTVTRWVESVPSDFVFALKAPQEVTHGGGAGSLLWPAQGQTWDAYCDLLTDLGADRCIALLQFSASFKFNRLDELATFLKNARIPSRCAVELRDTSWWRPETSALFRSHGIAWVSNDLAPLGEAGSVPGTMEAPYSPEPPVQTADFRYLRLCGRHGQYDDCDAREVLSATPRLEWWLAQLDDPEPTSLPLTAMPAPLPEVKTTFAFAGNSFAGYGVATTDRLRRLLSLPPREDLQPTLF